LARTHRAQVRSSGSGTLLRSRSLADYTIDMHEFEVFGSHRSSWGAGRRRRLGFFRPKFSALDCRPRAEVFLGPWDGKRFQRFSGKRFKDVPNDESDRKAELTLPYLPFQQSATSSFVTEQDAICRHRLAPGRLPRAGEAGREMKASICCYSHGHGSGTQSPRKSHPTRSTW
jgi:hypothetical protein